MDIKIFQLIVKIVFIDRLLLTEPLALTQCIDSKFLGYLVCIIPNMDVRRKSLVGFRETTETERAGKE